MNTFTKTLLIIGCSLCAAIFSLEASAQTFIGYMTYRSTWEHDGKNDPAYGWYTYNVDDNSFAQHTRNDNVVEACKGGTCAEGHLYAMESASDSWLFPDPKLHIYNAETYNLEHTVSYGRSDRDHATKDFAVSPADHQLYAIAQYRDGNTADGGWIQHYDLSTGEMTRIAHLPAYQHALAINAEGHFFTLSEDGTLYKVEWSSANTKEFKDYGVYPEALMTKIGATGFRLQNDITYANSLCFDYRSNRLFWAASVYPTENHEGTNVIVRGLFEISMTDGKATLLREFPDNIIFTALAVPYLTLDAPDDILDLSLRPQQPGSENIAIGFTAPATNYGQQPYAAGTQFRVHPMLDGRDYYQALLDAGYIGEGKALSEADFTVEAGKVWVGGPFRLSKDSYHTIGAFVENLVDGKVSQTAEQTIWVGFDTPITPQNVKLEYNRERTEATITWDPVATGIHGGDIDLKTLRYIVSRRYNNASEEKDIAFGITESTAHDAVDTPMSYTRYGVIALTDPAMSEEARSDYAVLGQPRELPFMSTFSYIGEFHQFITIDANGDGWDDWETPSWYFDSTYGAAFCYLNRLGEPQDDWLVTPALQLEEGEEYEVIFQTYGYYGNVNNHLAIAVGRYAEAEELGRVIYDKEYAVPFPEHFPYENDDVLTERVVFTAQEGDAYIGFHNMTNAFDHMSLDNIYIRKHESDDAGVHAIANDAASVRLYDLSGRPATRQQHGVSIVGGRKVVK